MSTPHIPTEHEHDLLDTARRVLGSNLFEFLFSGLGEPHYPRMRFTAASIREHGAALTYQLEAVAESEKGLPGGRDPLVMAALLHLLWTGGRRKDEVVFREEELLGLLSWPDTPESRLAVEAAVERYFNTGCHRTSREPMGEGRGEMVSSQVQKLITGIDTTLELREGPPKRVRKSTILHFTTKLVEEVTGAGKYFLGIDFEKLRLERTKFEGSSQSGEGGPV
jgi:hypothetical protein